MTMPRQNRRRRAIAYIRVSTEEQGQSGFGMQAQEAQIRAFAEEAGFNVMRVFSDVGSAVGGDTISKRAELREAFKLAKKHRWPVLVASLDRLSRNTAEVESFLDSKGIKVISAKNGATVDRAVMRGEAERAEKEAAMISERTRAALQRKKQEGVKLGNPTNLAEAQARGAATNRRRAAHRVTELEPVVREIRATGMATATEIADGLNARGFKTARGLTWNKWNVRRLLERIERTEPTEAMPEQPLNPLWGTF